jgi:feruloyl esterase
MYAGPVNPATGRRIFPGSTRGAETDSLFGWQSQGNAEPQFGSLFKWVFGLTFQATAFDFDRDMAAVDQLLMPILNANSADLSAFRARGGKLMHYQGTADPLVPAQDAIDYYHRVAQAQNGSFKVGLDRTRQFYRLFMVPGMAHCAYGPGPNAFGNFFSGQVTAPEPPSIDADHDAMTALQAWVEGGTPPDRLVATKYASDQPALGIESQRPICAYPLFPKYVAGDAKAPSSFTCADNGNAANAAINPMPAAEYLR